jgi:hypothetical protein
MKCKLSFFTFLPPLVSNIVVPLTKRGCSCRTPSTVQEVRIVTFSECKIHIESHETFQLCFKLHHACIRWLIKERVMWILLIIYGVGGTQVERIDISWMLGMGKQIAILYGWGEEGLRRRTKETLKAPQGRLDASPQNIFEMSGEDITPRATLSNHLPRLERACWCCFSAADDHLGLNLLLYNRMIYCGYTVLQTH